MSPWSLTPTFRKCMRRYFGASKRECFPSSELMFNGISREALETTYGGKVYVSMDP